MVRQSALHETEGSQGQLRQSKTMTDADKTLRELHAAYTSLSGQQPPFLTCQRRWYEWHKAGFAIDELRLVIEHVMRLNRKREAPYKVPLRFGSFIGDLERFGDLLGDARAAKRQSDYRAKHSYPPAKAEALRATGRPDAPEIPDGCIPAKEALARLRESLKNPLDTQT